MGIGMKIFFIGLIFISIYTGWKFGSVNHPEGSHSIDYVTDNQRSLDIIHYNLELDLDPVNRKIYGKTGITAVRLKELTTIDLNFYENLEVTALIVNGSPAEYTRKDNMISINYGQHSDTVNIEINYEGRPKRGGLAGFVFGTRNGKSVVYNLSEPNYASSWFPCNDFPSDKALLDISLTNDSSMVSVSNGKLMSVENHNEKKTYHWKTFYPISTYLVGIYSAPYKNFSDVYISRDGKDTMNIEYYVFEDQLGKAKVDFEDHKDYLNYFSSVFGEYPFIKEKYGVAEFLWQLGAMEHQTVSGIGSNFVSGRKFFDDIYVHELAHHWWGNAVGPSSWKDIWLNEGFATYSEALYAEHIAGPKALQSTMLSKFDENPDERLYAPEKNIFSSTIYDKGAWVLHMLRKETGDSVFFKILREYFNQYKYSNASVNDFKNVCEKISGKDLGYFFKQWVTEGKDIIRLTYKWKTAADGDKYSAIVNFEQTQVDYPVYNFPLDLEFLLTDGRKVRKTVRIDRHQQEIETNFDSIPVELNIDPDNWLLALVKNKVWD